MVIAEIWLWKASCGRRNVVFSGDPEVKLESVSIWRMRDSAVCPAPASLPPNPVLPTGKFFPPMLPCELPPVWDASLGGCHWREAEGCSGITKPGSASTSTEQRTALVAQNRL